MLDPVIGVLAQSLFPKHTTMQRPVQEPSRQPCGCLLAFLSTEMHCRYSWFICVKRIDTTVEYAQSGLQTRNIPITIQRSNELSYAAAICSIHRNLIIFLSYAAAICSIYRNLIIFFLDQPLLQFNQNMDQSNKQL